MASDQKMHTHNHQDSAPALLLHDGVCSVCDRLARWVQARDHQHKIQHLPQESAQGQALLKAHGLEEINALVMIQGSKVLWGPQATWETLRILGGPWKILANCCAALPQRPMAWLYQIFAQNRRRWFGVNTCALQTK